MVIAETQRLLLRELAPADAGRMFDIYRDPQTMAFMGPPPRSVEDEAEGIARHGERYYRRHGFGLWAVVEKASGEIIGRCGLLRFDLGGAEETEISYLLARSHWGNGYATEAAGAAVRFAFALPGVDRLHALVHPDNHASRRAAERLAFRRVGLAEYKQFGTVEHYRRHRDRAADGPPAPADALPGR